MAVDGRVVDLSETLAYKGMMLSGVPNLAFTVGYTNASWTLKADLSAEYVCRVLNHMDARGFHKCVPEISGASITEQPLLDFSAGYVLRSLDQLPKQGNRDPWRLGMNYAIDIRTMRFGAVDDGTMRFSRSPARTPSSTNRPEAAGVR